MLICSLSRIDGSFSTQLWYTSNAFVLFNMPEVETDSAPQS